MRRPSRAEPAIVAALLASTLVLGVVLRLADPLSTRALGAEDPYTHVVFTKEWLEQGYFADSFHLGTGMYPPGMHAFVGAFAPLAGVDLYDFARIAPALFGALAILGMFALGQRLAGNAAGLAAAFVTAVLPEHIFRTELLFPTALDLALLPLWLIGYHMAITTHRAQGAVVFVGASLPLAIMHPWIVPLFAAPLAVFVALRALRGHLDRTAVVDAAALLIAPVGFAMAFRWNESDTGFADFFAQLGPLAGLSTLELPRPVLFLTLTIVLSVLALAGVGVLQLAMRVRLPRAWSVALGAILAAGILLALQTMTRDPPYEVNYRDMLGPFAILLALTGLVLALVRPTALGDLAAAISVTFFPLTAIDIFGSPFWPQRTVAYLCIGVALLAATLASHAHELPQRLARNERSRATVGIATLLALALVFAGGAVATHDSVYKWYRLYNEDHFAAFEKTADIVAEDPDAKVFVYTWQPALMIKTLTDPDHVWYAPGFFSDGAERAERLEQVQAPAYVLVDKHTLQAEKDGEASLGFLDDGGKYRLIHKTDDGRFKLYEVLK